MTENAGSWKRAVTILALILVLAFAARWWLGDSWDLSDLSDSRERAATVGPSAPIAFILVYALATLLLLPGTPLTLAAGLLFGPVVGVLYAWAGASLGASGAYGLARGGRGAPHAWLQRRFGKLTRYVERHSLGAVLTLRLIPLVPFNALNYGLGFAGVPPRPYLIGTLLGILPGTTAYVLFGAAAGSAARWSSPEFYVPLAVAILLAGLGAIVARRLEPRGSNA